MRHTARTTPLRNTQGVYALESHSSRGCPQVPRQPFTSAANPGNERSPDDAAQSASDPTRSMS
jgi:hypothetical protein